MHQLPHLHFPQFWQKKLQSLDRTPLGGNGVQINLVQIFYQLQLYPNFRVKSKYRIQTWKVSRLFERVGHVATYSLLEITIFSQYHVIFRRTKTINNILKYCKIIISIHSNEYNFYPKAGVSCGPCNPSKWEADILG